MNKYRNKPCEFNGEKYRSQKERDRHLDLIQCEKVGLIADLKREVPFVLALSVKVQGRKRPALRYIADFTYTKPLGPVVEDCKGVRTTAYNIKRHLMMSVHGVEIFET